MCQSSETLACSPVRSHIRREPRREREGECVAMHKERLTTTRAATALGGAQGDSVSTQAKVNMESGAQQSRWLHRLVRCHVVDYAMCPMFSGRNTQTCLSYSKTENVGAGNRGSANAPTRMAIVCS